MTSIRILIAAVALLLPAAGVQAATHVKTMHVVHPKAHVTKVAAKHVHHTKAIAHPGA